MDIIIKGREEVTNEDYNFLKKRMKRLEECYKQSCDQQIRNAVKDKTLFEICERFPSFYEDYGESFEACKMSSLKEVADLVDMVLAKYSIEKLSPITMQEAKKILKLKEKALKQFVKGYNEAVARENLTYYSQRIDDKLVCLTEQNGEFVGAATDISKGKRNGECLCHFCRRFRRGDEIVFVTNSARTAKGEYSSIGQSICSDYEACNRDIEERQPVVKFLSYKLEKGNER